MLFICSSYQSHETAFYGSHILVLLSYKWSDMLDDILATTLHHPVLRSWMWIQSTNFIDTRQSEHVWDGVCARGRIALFSFVFENNVSQRKHVLRGVRIDRNEATRDYGRNSGDTKWWTTNVMAGYRWVTITHFIQEAEQRLGCPSQSTAPTPSVMSESLPVCTPL